jgi:hypothetical protein
MATPSDVPQAVYHNADGNIMVGNIFRADNGAQMYIGGKRFATNASPDGSILVITRLKKVDCCASPC